MATDKMQAYSTFVLFEHACKHIGSVYKRLKLAIVHEVGQADANFPVYFA